MKLYPLSITVLELGNNVKKLLDGLTSNKLDAPDNACTDIKGKIITTFQQVWTGPDNIFLAVPSSATDRLITHLQRYAKLCKTQIQSREDLNVYYLLESLPTVQADEYLITQSAGAILISQTDYEKNVSDEEFLAFRLEHSLPLQDIDYHDEMLLNVHPTRFVSFNKGCFLGQEVLARVHHKSAPPRKLIVQDGQFVFVKNT